MKFLHLLSKWIIHLYLEVVVWTYSGSFLGLKIKFIICHNLKNGKNNKNVDKIQNSLLNLFLVRVKLHLEVKKKGFHFSVKGKNLKAILEKNN